MWWFCWLTHSCLACLHKSLPQEIGDTKLRHVSLICMSQGLALQLQSQYASQASPPAQQLHQVCKIPRFEKTLPPQWDPNFERSSCKDPANFDWSLYTHFLHPDWSQINLSVANVFVSPTARYKKYPQNGRNLLGLEVNSSGTVQGLDDCDQNLLKQKGNWCTWKLKHPFINYKWLFQVDDSKYLHGKWFFNQKFV